MKKSRFQWLLLLVTSGLYALFYLFNEPVNFETCQLCDGKQYLKLYWYFESGTVSQITYPFYTRPLVPLLASLIPGDNPHFAFHFVNFLFILAGVSAIHSLWEYLNIPNYLKCVGFGWLLLHWTGILRYNLFDYITVDVPLYFFQTLALLLFLKGNFRWLYFITPIAILQKESFIGIIIMFLAIHIWENKHQWFRHGQHLIYALLIGLAIQYLVIDVLMPGQNHKWHPLLTLILVLKMTIDDPTRLIRWFAAFGGAFGILPIIIPARIRKISDLKLENKILLVLSIMYCWFGLFAGEDMTRILFLGFPFIMTLSLIYYKSASKTSLAVALILSIASLRIFSLPIQNEWGVDYREISYVLKWAIYYMVALMIFFLATKLVKKKA